MLLVSQGMLVIAYKIIVTLGTVTANRTECWYQITETRQVKWEPISCVWEKKWSDYKLGSCSLKWPLGNLFY